jgi:hypothetical protein
MVRSKANMFRQGIVTSLRVMSEVRILQVKGRLSR